MYAFILFLHDLLVSFEFLDFSIYICMYIYFFAEEMKIL